MRHHQKQKARNFKFFTLAMPLILIIFLIGMTRGSGLQTTDASQVAESRSGFASLSEHLRQIIASHPEPEISQDLYQQIMMGEIGLDFSNHSGTVAVFAVTRDQLIPVVSFDQVTLTNASPTDPKLWLVLSHEYTHYQQWVRAESEEQRGIFLAGNRPKDVDPAICTEYWKAEREAYYHECELALALDVDYLLGDLCTSTENDTAFNRKLFTKLSQNPIYSSCTTTWTELIK